MLATSFESDVIFLDSLQINTFSQCTLTGQTIAVSDDENEVQYVIISNVSYENDYKTYYHNLKNFTVLKRHEIHQIIITIVGHTSHQKLCVQCAPTCSVKTYDQTWFE